MPSAADFKKAFHLSKDAKLKLGTRQGVSVGQVQNSTVGHEVKRQNERYEFPSTLELQLDKNNDLTKRQIEAAVRHHTSHQPTVYSAYGSPYLCSIHNVKATKFDPEARIAEINFLGKAVRRRDIPTLAQQKEEERKRKSGKDEEEEISPESAKKWLADMRVIKSRFGTFTCAECGEVIDPGVKIARKKDFSGRGGWMHITCAVLSAKRAQISRPRKRRKRS